MMQFQKKLWRFHTVPDNPEKINQSKAMKAALKTWNGEWWKYGGGGTVWDSFAYDPNLELVYVGTGNGSPWNQEIRSPEVVITYVYHQYSGRY